MVIEPVRLGAYEVLSGGYTRLVNRVAVTQMMTLISDGNHD
jgi:hypothetical protein